MIHHPHIIPIRFDKGNSVEALPVSHDMRLLQVSAGNKVVGDGSLGFVSMPIDASILPQASLAEFQAESTILHAQ